MEENKSSFYGFLAQNAKPVSEPSQTGKVPQKYIIFSWLFLFVVNSFLLWVAWNNAIVTVFPSVSHMSFVNSVLVYTAAKILTRGFFTIQ